MLVNVFLYGFDDMLLIESTELFRVNILESFFTFVFINEQFHFHTIGLEPENHFFEHFSFLHRH